ncbi:TonB family protein [Gilvimarinus agarilyticus]|uniref:TonB family protein n=1 Tax=Gilvimarinus sp. 2_MG-2023 TaxID=3062666 RepID=UPI001C0A4324|nr:TonB family protein [Gilvimarinus sp. 2_MG-2023]MBU2887833.1 TonB family protein [Gilvimarinus agarilyticus]MDO6572471.1 TonB family protein [Gilvimarinus sp. 2_MG-2023]
MMYRIALIFALSFFSLFAGAQSSSAPTGLAPFVELNREAFLMALYVPGGAGSAQEALSHQGSRALELKFTQKRMTAGKLSRLFLQSIAINAHPQTQRASADSLAQFFNALKGSLHQSDVLIISEKTDASGVFIYLNGHTLADIEDRQFFNLLLVAWIGAVPPNTVFKAALLGDYPAEDLARLRAITPTAERRTAVATWLQPAESAAPLETQGEAAQTQERVVSEKPVEQSSTANTAAAVEAPVEEPALSDPASAPVATAQRLPAQAEPVLKPEVITKAEPAESSPAQVAGVNSLPIAPEPEEDLPNFSVQSLTALQDYTSRLVQLTHQHIEYPRRAMKLKQTGSVRMGVVINRQGEVVDMQLLLASEYKQLNQAVERAIEGAAPYPPLLESIGAESFEFIFPITFMLDR